MDEGMGIKWDRQREKELTKFHKKQKERRRSIEKVETKDSKGWEARGRREGSREREEGWAL